MACTACTWKQATSRCFFQPAAQDYFQRPQMNEIFARKTDELRRQSVPEAVEGVNSERLRQPRVGSEQVEDKLLSPPVVWLFP